jgi:hypothetical protein
MSIMAKEGVLIRIGLAMSSQYEETIDSTKILHKLLLLTEIQERRTILVKQTCLVRCLKALSNQAI